MPNTTFQKSTTDEPEEQCLVLGDEDAGWRHYLLGRDIHCGQQLEIKNGSLWIPVRYEAGHGEDGRIFPVLYCLAGRLYPERDAIYRWPAH